MSKLKIGFVGLGDQGAPMAEAISDAGFELHVWARRAQALDAISRVKCLRHDNLQSLAVMVDVLSLCLRDDEDIWNLIRQHRLIEALQWIEGRLDGGCRQAHSRPVDPCCAIPIASGSLAVDVTKGTLTVRQEPMPGTETASIS